MVMCGLEELIMDIFRLLIFFSALIWPPCIPSVRLMTAKMLKDSQHFILTKLHSLMIAATTSALAYTAKGLGLGKSLRIQEEIYEDGEFILARRYKVRTNQIVKF